MFSQLIDNVWHHSHHSIFSLQLLFKRSKETIHTHKDSCTAFCLVTHFKRFRQVPCRTLYVQCSVFGIYPSNVFKLEMFALCWRSTFSLSLCSDKQKHQTLNIACIQQYNTLAYLHYTCYKFIDWLGVSSGSSGALWIYSLLCCCTRIRPTKCLTNDLVGQSKLKKSHAKHTNTHAKHLPIKTASKISQETCSRQRIKAVCNSYNLHRQNNRWIEDWIRIDDVERIQIQGLFVQHHRIYWMTKGTDGKIILKMQHL